MNLKQFFTAKKINILALSVLLVLTAWIYQPVFKSGWLNNWDDDLQVTNNPDITAISFTNLKNIFSSFYVGMYQPLTTFFYALEYHWFGLNPNIFHGTNLLLHLLNIVLVYCLVKKILIKFWPSFGVAAIFALHPMQVEAVAWISARSTLLCSTFILLGVLTYWRYAQLEKRTNLWKTFIIFILAIFTKALAIVFPLILILIDWYHQKLNKKTLLEKIPFFIISLLFTWLALVGRKRAEHLLDLGSYYSLWDKTTFVLSSLFFYVAKLFWPINLSPFYNYPPKINNLLPISFYIMAGLAVILIASTLWAIIRFKHQPFGRLLTLASSWFILNLILILKILPVGFQYAADRYNYLAMLGPLLLLAYGLDKLTTKQPKTKIIVIVLIIFISASLSFISRQTTMMWHDNLTLINKAISQAHPDTNLYMTRGVVKNSDKDYQGALDDLNYSLSLNNENLTAHYNRALVLSGSFQRYQEALADLNFVINSQPTASAYYERGNIKATINDLPGTIADYSEAIKLSDNWLYLFNRANIYGQLKKYPEALADYNQAIELVPDFSSAYYYKGVTLSKLGKNSQACEAWQAGKKIGLKLGPHLEKLCLNKGE